MTESLWCGYCENKVEEHEIGFSYDLNRACNSCYVKNKVKIYKQKWFKSFIRTLILCAGGIGLVLVILNFLTSHDIEIVINKI